MRVLLAEDDAITRMDLVQILQDMGAVEVGQCSRGDRAIQMALQGKWDFVVLDIAMPVMNGLTVAEFISRRMLAPVVLLTAYSDIETVEQADKSGVLAYLVKPVDPHRLMAAGRLAMARFAEMKKIRADVLALRSEKAGREAVGLAKKVMQEKWRLSEEQAYSFIRRESMRHQKKMSVIAEEILAGRLGPDEMGDSGT